MLNSDNLLINPPKRKRSSSLDSKKVLKYRDKKLIHKQMKRYSSSGNLFNFDNVEMEKNINSPKLRMKSNVESNNYFLFVNWYKDFKNTRQSLLALHDPNLFKTEFPKQIDMNHKGNPPIVFFVDQNLKIENEYEAYLISDYNTRLKEMLEWSEKKDIHSEYTRGLELINKQIEDESNGFLPNEDNEQKSGDKKINPRRHSEAMALIVQNKNQPMQTFLPREYQGYLTVVHYTCEFEIIYINQDKKLEKNYKLIPRIGILTNIDINIYTRNMKLKDSYVLRHLFIGQCNDTQIANVDSCLRIGGPFGNDMIIRFPNPQSRNDWNKYINEQIAIYQETLKNSIVTITIFNDTNGSLVPLVSKAIPINGTTVGLNLKKMAMATFDIKDVDSRDLTIAFQIKNKEYFLHDDVSLMVLQEHVNNIQENNCVRTCLESDKLIAIVKIIYYLRSNKPSTEILLKDIVKIKKLPIPKTKEDFKVKQNKYNINSKWIDNEIPNWLLNLLADLYNEGAKCEGIFRMSGVVSHSDDCIIQICEIDDIKIDFQIHTKASILKKFISIIDGSLLTTITKEIFSTLTSDIYSVEEFLIQEEQQSKLVGLLQRIPQDNLNLFQHILVLLNHIIENSNINQMSYNSLATCFSQNLFKHLSDEAVKINKLFECILHLIPRIVDKSTYKKIVESFEKRKPSISSGDVIRKSDLLDNYDGISISSSTPRTNSFSADEIKSPEENNSPLAPPRRKKGITRHNKKLTSPAFPISKRKSYHDSHQHDETDSVFQLNEMSDEAVKPSKSNVIAESKLTRGHKTFNSPSTGESQPMNFIRQNQVNRKHLKNLDNTSQTSAKDNINQIKPDTKLTRSNETHKQPLRSKSKAGNNVPATQRISKSTSQYFSQSSSIESNYPPNKVAPERQRSSSANNRSVTILKEKFEFNVTQPKQQVVSKKNSFISENSQNVPRIVKDIEENSNNRSSYVVKQNITRKLNGPIRAHPTPQFTNAQKEKSKFTSIINSRQSLLHEKLNDSNDDDVTYI